MTPHRDHAADAPELLEDPPQRLERGDLDREPHGRVLPRAVHRAPQVEHVDTFVAEQRDQILQQPRAVVRDDAQVDRVCARLRVLPG